MVRRELGLELRVTILNSRLQRLKERRRNLAGRSGCGLCGAESLEATIRPPARVSASLRIDHSAIDRAVTALAGNQPLQHRTGGLHAAAWCSPEGGILLVREDVGRHNALDKLLGALALDDGRSPGFVLMSSRASYEIVSKSAAANVPLLVTLSAPSALAIDLATRSAITLVGFAATGRHVIYSGAPAR